MTHPTPTGSRRPILARAALALTLGLSLSGCLWLARFKEPVIVNGVSYAVRADGNNELYVEIGDTWYWCVHNCRDTVLVHLDQPPEQGDPADRRRNDGGDGERNDGDDEERGE